ncbi:type II toxin-antitoxin system RelE/ParE family toxin [Caballeronia sp. 15715]|uniref:type II toxin-antitoxin system RelE/ParE family toxin n=1 Tax=Caballeronia sp. 15715 TaxID=3391030 RepID=UPI0039E514D5
MKLAAVIQDTWSVYEVLNPRGDTVLGDIAGGKDWDRCAAFLAHAARHGPEAFAENRTHHVGDDPKVWQFDVTGTLRLLYFYDAGRVIVLTKCFYKAGGKSGKTPKTFVKAAQQVYVAYEKAKLAGALEFIEGEEDEDQ